MSLNLGVVKAADRRCATLKVFADSVNRNFVQRGGRTSQISRSCENLRPDQLRLERLALLLRTAEGVPLAHLRDLPPGRIEELQSGQLATVTNGRFRLVGRGPLLVDSITEFLVG